MTINVIIYNQGDDRMKSLFDYINNNTFLATIIGIVLGWLLNFISTMYFHKKDKHEKQQELNRKEKQKHFENKPELYICKEDEQQNADIEIFLAPFQTKYDKNNNYEIVYSKNLKNKKNHEYKDVTVKNIGKSDINSLDIISTDKRVLSLISYDNLDNLLDNKYVWYNYCYDRKIRPGNRITIRIYYEKDKYPYMLFSSTLAFLFEDQNHNNWEQPFFYEQEKVYPPHFISYKEYRQKITTDDAYDCFEKPWLW